jgi:hypothetical protein
MFDFSQLPFNNTRLIKYSDTATIFEQTDLSKIIDLQVKVATIKQDNSTFPDIILLGNDAINRSKLAISIGCEFISFWKGVYSVSFVKLLEKKDILLDIIKHNQSPHKFFIKAFILDDINVNLPLPNFVVTSENVMLIEPLKEPSTQQEKDTHHFFEAFIKIYSTHPEICFIWVLSGKSEDRLKLWMEFINHFSGGDFIEINIKNKV